MNRKVIIAGLVSGALSFAIGFIGGAVLNRPARQKINSEIMQIEMAANKQKKLDDNKNQELQKEINRLKYELKNADVALSEAYKERKKYKDELASANKLKKQETDNKLKKQEAERATALQQKEKEIKQNKATENIRQLDKQIDEMLSSGAIHSINVEFNEIRIDPVIWLNLGLEQKQGLVMFFSNYFEVKRSTGRVTIFSNRNDQKLGSYSVWSGVKIYQ